MERSRPQVLTRGSLAGLIFTVALTGVVLQYQVTAALPDLQPVMGVAWRLAGYFTILTNLGVACLMLSEFGGRQLSPRTAGGMMLSIAVVGILYHLILARLWSPTGLAWWADQTLHTVVPILSALWWYGFAGKAVSLRDLPSWLVWPLAYACYALIRGQATGFWPYPFLDADTLGWSAVAWNVGFLVVTFLGLGVATVVLARRLIR